MPVVSALPGLTLRAVNEAAGTISFSGPLGSNDYTFRVGDCNAVFGVVHGPLYTVTRPAGHPICLHRLIALGTLDGSSADGGRPLFVFDTQELGVYCLRDATDASSLQEYGWVPVDPATTPYSTSVSGGATNGATSNPADDAERLEHLQRRYGEYSAELAGPHFGGFAAPYTFLCADLYLRENYGVSHGECVAFATIAAPRAEIVGEAMGCMWVRNDGALRPLPGADTERALVMLYGMSDAAPHPAASSGTATTRSGVRIGALDSPRRVVRATSPAASARVRATSGPTGSRAAGAATVATALMPPPPFTAGKQTPDGLPAVECQCPLGVTVLAVASPPELERQFQVKPNQLLTVLGGPDAGRITRVLGINRGNLVVHIAEAAKCTVLRNCADGAELRQRFSVDGSTAAPFKAMVPRLRLGALDGSAAGGGENKSPGSGGGAEPSRNSSFFGKLVASLTPRGTSTAAAAPATKQSVDAAFATLSAAGPGAPRSPGAASSSADDFWYWTVHGRAQFDVSPAACLHFGFHHGDSLRFTRGAEAGNVFHVLGVKAGALFVVPDVSNSDGRAGSTSSGLESPRAPGAVRRCAVPIRHCHDKAQLKVCVEPIKIGRVALESQAATSRPPLTPLSSPRVADKTPVLGPSLGHSRRHSGISVGGPAHSSSDASSHPRETLQLPVGPSAAALAANAAGTGTATNTSSYSGGLKSPMHMRLRSADTDSLVNDSFTSPVTAYPPAPMNSPATQAGAEAGASVARDILASPYQAPAMLRARGLSGASAISGIVHADPAYPATSNTTGAADGGSTSSRGGGGDTPVITVTPAAETAAASAAVPVAPTPEYAEVPAPASVAYAAADHAAGEAAAAALGKLARMHERDRKRRTEPRPFPVGVMPATRHYLKAVALHALGLSREAEAPAAFYDFYAIDPTQRLSIAVESLPHFVEYWDLHQDTLGLPAFEAAETDEMVPLMSRMDAEHQYQQ